MNKHIVLWSQILSWYGRQARKLVITVHAEVIMKLFTGFGDLHTVYLESWESFTESAT